MIFKTTLKDINNVAVAIDKLNKVTSTIRIADDKNKNYTLYGAAIDGLNEKQLALALSTQRLSDIELEEVIDVNNLIEKYGAETLIKNGLLTANSRLLTSEKAVNAEDMQKLLIKKGVNEEEATEFIQKQLNVIANGEESTSTVLLNKALMDEAVKRGVLSTEKATEILSTYGIVTADVSETASKKALTSATWAQVKAQAALLKSNPIAWIVGAAVVIYGVVKAYDALTVTAEEAKEAVNSARSEFEESSSNLQSLNSEFESTNEKIAELESKGTLTFTDKAELENLKEQNRELEKSIHLQEEKGKNAASKVVKEIRDNKDTLDKDFNISLNNFSEYKKEAENIKKTLLSELNDGIVSPDYYEKIVGDAEDTLDNYKTDLIDNIEVYEQNKQSIIDKYSTSDSSQFSISDKALYDDIQQSLQDAYKTLYSHSDYNKFIIEPIFNEDAFEGLQEQLLDYFVNGGKANLSSLEDRFGSDIITALKNAFENESIDFDEMIGDMYDNATGKLDQIAPIIEKPNGSFDARQNWNSKNIRNYIQNELSGEDRTLLLNAEIPEDVKFETIQDVQDFIDGLKEKTGSNENAILSPLSFDQAWNSLEDISGAFAVLEDSRKESLQNTKNDLLELARAGKLTVKAFNDTKGSDIFLEQIGMSAEEAINKINDLVDHTDKLSAMKSGISSLSSILGEKKENQKNKNTRNTGIGADTLAGLDDSFKDLEAWKEYEKTLADGTSSMKDCRNATNKLATAWVNSNEFLSKLTSGTKKQNEASKQMYISMLNEMGVENAEEVVLGVLSQALDNNTQKKVESSIAVADLSDGIQDDEIAALSNEAQWINAASEQTKQYYMQKLIANKNSLDTSESVNNLIALAKQCGYTGNALTKLTELQKLQTQYSQLQNASLPSEAEKAGVKEARLKQLENQIAEKKKEVEEAVSQPVKIEIDTESTDPSDSKDPKNPDDSSPTKETAQEIDWIDRRLNVLQKKLSKTQAAYDNIPNPKEKGNLSVFKKRNLNLAKQIRQLDALASASETAANKYKKYADSVNLSEGLKAKVRSGDYDISEYSGELAEKINKYRDYTDKYLENLQKVDEYAAQKREKQEEKYQLKVDRTQAKIDRFNAAIDLNSGNYEKQNNLLDKQNKYIEKSYKYQLKIAKLNGDNIRAKQLELELEQKLSDTEKQKFENIQNGFENEISISQAKTSKLDAKAGLLEAKGQMVSVDIYEKQKDQEQERLSLLKDEENQLEKQLKNITKGTDAWYEAKKALIEVRTEIINTKTEIVNANAAITELADSANEKLRNSVQSLADEFGFMAELFADEEMFDSGNITSYGIGTLGSYVIGKETSEKQIENTRKLIEDMKANRNNGTLSFIDSNGFKREYDSVEQMDEAIHNLYSNWQDEIKAKNDYESKIIDMMKQKYQAELDAQKEVIDAKKKSLNAAKDLHDYEKSIQNSTQNISSIQKQIAALQGDTSEEGMARVQKLQNELADAQDELNEREYDRYISDQQDMLDGLYAQYEDLIQNEMKDTKKLLEKGIQCFNDDFARFTEVYKDTAAKYSYDYENAGVSSIINNTANGIAATDSIKGILETVYADKLANVQQAAGREPGQGGSQGGGQGGITPGASSGNKVDGAYNAYKDAYNSISHLSAMEKGSANEASIKALKKALHVLNFDNSNPMTDAEINEGKWGAKLKNAIQNFKNYKGLKGDSEHFNENAIEALIAQLKLQGGFKTGGIAELIKAKGEDGIAMVRNGEGILTPEQTKTFTAELVPRIDHIIDASKILANIPAPLGSISTQPAEVNFEINFDNVNGADDVLHKLQTDSTYRRAIQDVTIGQITGSGSRLSVNRFH